MNPPRSPASPSGHGYPSKRARTSPAEPESRSPALAAAGPSSEHSPLAAVEVLPEGAATRTAGSSSFRNVSACNRCRLRKNRCDQRLPSCASCAKAGVKCVGYDPITKRQIPRSYVFYLETRVGYLENLLQSSNIPFAPAEVLDLSSRPGPDPNATHTPSDDGRAGEGQELQVSLQQRPPSQQEQAWNKKREDATKLDKLVSNVGMISVQGASDPRYLGSTSGISFARVVFAAVKSSVSGANSDKGSNHSHSRAPASTKAVGAGGTSMRDSFFGLQTKPTIKPAPFPDRELALRLVNFYFEHANPQVPILHRGEFMKMFELVYGDKGHVRTPRESYMLNIVFAIGAGIYLGDPDTEPDTAQTSPTLKKAETLFRQRRTSNSQCQPEEYHASAIVHLEACLQSTMPVDRPDGFGGGLEELQAVLLLAGFALLRPVAPGLWYITGVAVRLAVDLGLHYEDGKDIDAGLSERKGGKTENSEHERHRQESNCKEKGRREWMRDFRRRLWWCTYSFDRLVSTCVGRPFGITDQVITTEFPSILEDKFITPSGFLAEGANEPSSKHVAYHYFRFRLLQSEILQVLQHQQAQQVRAGGTNQRNPFMHTRLPSPFLSKFDSFRSWRIDIDKRLWEWKESAPTPRQSGVQFSHGFLELNYWQAVIMLYRQSLSVPPQFEGEYNVSEDVESPSAHTVELREDEQRVFLKVAEAGQKVLRLYRHLHRVHLVNYTFLATHQLFMAGISFLYAIWHSPIVRSRLTMDEVDFTILAATSVLGDLVEKCPPAEACRDAFDRMSKATVQMCMSTTGFSSSASGLHSSSNSSSSSRPHRPLSGDNTPDYLPAAPSSTPKFATSNARGQKHHLDHAPAPAPATRLPKPHFDMALNDLYAPSPVPSAAQLSNGSARTAATANAGVKTEFANDAFGIPRSQMHSPSDYAISPTMTREALAAAAAAEGPSSIEASLQQPGGGQMGYLGDMYVPGYGDMQFGLDGMDFLNEGGGGGAYAGEGGGGGGLELGFGWGAEGEGHDFSEGGNQLDFFDGFYFGTGV